MQPIEITQLHVAGKDPHPEGFQAKVTAVKELIEHHADEEEEELFPKVEKAMEEESLKELGKAMKARFVEAVEAGWQTVYTPGLKATKTLADAASGKLVRARARKHAA